MKSINILKKYIILFLLFGLIPYSYSSSYQEVMSAFREVAYSYYMRGKNIQYNLAKVGFFPPEEVTSQNINYLVCSGYVRTVFRDLMNITTPYAYESIKYPKEKLGYPESIAYSYINNQNKPVLLLYSEKDKNYKNTTEFSIKDIISSVKSGDILSHTGHQFLVYDVEKDSEGNVVDALLIESGYGKGKSYIKSKLANHEITTEAGITVSPFLSFLFHNNKFNKNFEEGHVEGTVGVNRLSQFGLWTSINNVKTRMAEYSILRIIQSDSKGNAILKFKTLSPKLPNQFLYNDTIILSDKIKDRLKFRRLYIEKTVNKFNNNIVLLGDILNYTIIIKNNHNEDYTNDLIINENISEFVIYQTHSENKDIISFNYNKNNKILTWNIGKLKKNEEIIINYTVKIAKGSPGDIILSTGFVNNIPSSTVTNTIGICLNKYQKNLISKNYEKLIKKYNGKLLINEIYKNAFDVDIKFDKFNISNLINISGLNKNNSFYGAVLNKYWSRLSSSKHKYIPGGKEVEVYYLESFSDYSNPERRQDFIYKETLQTGDILIYLNRNDATYSVDKDNKLVKTYITYEEGEYAYIYIENKGFVGVNLGDDNKKNTKDDRNEFNSKYYKDNNLTLYMKNENAEDDLLEEVNLQTVFGKDLYVILRPSLCFDFPTDDGGDNETIMIILILVFLVIILGLGLYVFLKFRKIKREGKEFNFENFKKELLLMN